MQGDWAGTNGILGTQNRLSVHSIMGPFPVRLVLCSWVPLMGEMAHTCLWGFKATWGDREGALRDEGWA